MILRGIAVLALLTGLTTAPASAQGTGTEACSENVPPVSSQYIRNKGNSRIIYGAVQLRRDTCYQYWGYVQLYQPMNSSNERASAFLVWWEEGVHQFVLSCADPGGNGYIVSGQTTCRTPKKSRALVDGFLASAHMDVRADGDVWRTFGVGQTARMPGGV